MIAWVLVGIWNVLSLAIMIVPVGLFIHRWERIDLAAERAAYSRGEPQPKPPLNETIKRWGIGLVVFTASLYIASVMYRASEALYWSLMRHAAF